MQLKSIDIENKAKELGLDYHFLLIAIETTMMYNRSEDKRIELWDRVVWLQYFNMNVANFKKSKKELDVLDDRLKSIVEKSFEPCDLNLVDENSRAKLIEFARGEDVKLYHLYSLQAATEIYFDFKKRYNNMLIIDFVLQYFGYVVTLLRKDMDSTLN